MRRTPIAMLGGLVGKTFEEWARPRGRPRPPVFILVCKNTQIAKVVYEWLAEDKPPLGHPAVADRRASATRTDRINTIRVDTKVVNESDDGRRRREERRIAVDALHARHGRARRTWPRDRQGRPIYPRGFEELAKKLERPLHPPGRDVRCIVSVGMLTEGWDCNTVTHIVGLRPFMSQLLCEQVVGRGLRRASYELASDGLLTEEVAKVFGVPFEVIPFKANRRRRDRRSRSGITCIALRQARAVRDPLPACRGLHAGDSQPRDGGLGRRCRR